jgi:sugar/nucleoside kinase (ribokinase family)
MTRSFAVLAIGHALTDLLTPITEAQLAALAVPKGGMVLHDSAQAQHLLTQVTPQKVMSGGSAANTIVGLAQAGVRVAFAGRVGADLLGQAFVNDLAQHNITSYVTQATDGTPSGHCCILITPDGERSMATYLGASSEVTDTPPAQNAQVLYIEGYLWDKPTSIQTLHTTLKTARTAGTQCALTLSDSFCVERHRDDFLALLQQGALDILFANEAELCALYKTDNFDAAFAAAQHGNTIVVATCGARGAFVRQQQYTFHAVAHSNIRVIDATGAGDLFAAGFLQQYTAGQTLAQATTAGCDLAARVIAQMGARLPNVA